jgi:hypothetical protein
VADQNASHECSPSRQGSDRSNTSRDGIRKGRDRLLSRGRAGLPRPGRMPARRLLLMAFARCSAGGRISNAGAPEQVIDDTDGLGVRDLPPGAPRGCAPRRARSSVSLVPAIACLDRSRRGSELDYRRVADGLGEPMDRKRLPRATDFLGYDQNAPHGASPFERGRSPDNILAGCSEVRDRPAV